MKVGVGVLADLVAALLQWGLLVGGATVGLVVAYDAGYRRGHFEGVRDERRKRVAEIPGQRDPS